MSSAGDINNFFINLNTSLTRFTKEFASEFQQRVEQKTPVLSGDLKGGWYTETHRGGFDLSNTMPYAAYVEFGTPEQAPQAMIGRTLLEKEIIRDIAFQRAGIKK